MTRGRQAGDLQGLSGVEEADSESVRGLVEEGQAFEAEVIDAVENAPDPDVAEITTREVPEDDVPSEYLVDRLGVKRGRFGAGESQSAKELRVCGDNDRGKAHRDCTNAHRQINSPTEK